MDLTHSNEESGVVPMKKDVMILIPAYNEENSIQKLLLAMKELQISDWADIVVVNDGSKDNTGDIVRSFEVELIDLVYNMGYGSALQVGYKYAVNSQYEYIIQMDADGQHDIINIEHVYKALTKGKGNNEAPDIVIGSRFLNDSISFRVSFLKRLVILFFSKLIKRTTGFEITDPTSGLQGLNRQAFSYYSGFSNFDYTYPDINMIVQMLLNGFHIMEIPAVMHERKEGTSMHAGIIKPIKYMFLMTLSTMNAILRNKKKLKWNKEL